MKNFFYCLLFVICLFASCSDKPNSESADNNPSDSSIKFVDQTKSSGVEFTHVPTRTKGKLLPEIMGSGVATADFNRDGAPDILLANSGSLLDDTRPKEAANRLYINDGKGKFTDQTAQWGLTGTGYGQGVAVGDIDNDGLIDVFLTNFEGDNRLLRNTGDKFEDVSAESGLKADNKWSTSAGFFDYDNDGDLDLWTVRYVDFTTDSPHKVYRNRMQIYSTPIYFNGYTDQLLENDGSGKFTDVSKKAGLGRAGNGLALGLVDLDKDGDIDAYVANDSDENHLWINEGNGTFKETGQLSGSAYDEFGKEQGSMGVDFSDFDDNGNLDIVVTNFQNEPNALYSQTKPLLFDSAGNLSGLAQPSLSKLSFGIDFFDADNDGDEDLLVANGHIEDNVEESSDSVTFAQKNSLFENKGGGKFIEIGESAGDAFAEMQVSRGLAIADFDSDGDLDFVVVNNGGTAQLGFNETESKGNFVGLILEGDKSNRSAIGARLVATIGKNKIERQIQGAQSYLSVSDFRVHFGLGNAEKIDTLEVFWPGGSKQTVSGIEAGKYYLLKQDKEPEPFDVGTKRS
jgi:hypothetical protein